MEEIKRELKCINKSKNSEILSKIKQNKKNDPK